MSSTISSARAITIFSIMSGVATGVATLYLSGKFSNKDISTKSVALAIALAFGVSLGSAFIFKEAMAEEQPPTSMSIPIPQINPLFVARNQ